MMHNQITLTCLILIVFFLAKVTSLRHEASYVNYWKTKLPNVAIPNAITLALPSSHIPKNPADSSWVNSDEVTIQAYSRDGHGGNNHGDQGGITHEYLQSRFILTKDLDFGSNITLQLKMLDDITTKFPTQQNDLPPFNPKYLFRNLEYFSIKPDTEAAYVLNLTLQQCAQRNPMMGKWQHCATSLEDFLDFANSTLGWKGRRKIIAGEG